MRIEAARTTETPMQPAVLMPQASACGRVCTTCPKRLSCPASGLFANKSAGRA